MKYDYFMGMVKQYETDRIKAFPGKSATATEHIPSPFALLMQNVINILNENIQALCKVSEKLVIMGLQPACQMIQSSQAHQLNRYFDDGDPNKHLCCTLDYLVDDKQSDSHEWQQTNTVIIDFTAGEVMDQRAYLQRLALCQDDGYIYGDIKPDLLQTAWQIFNIRRIRQRNMKKVQCLGRDIVMLTSN